MNITYIYHSCFVVELEHNILLFDYYRGDLPTFDLKKHLYVFVSHRHLDHFNEKIFTIKHPSITYILSDDISYVHQGIYKLGPHQGLEIADLHISTLLSTDEGVAFLVKVEGKTIYHAGDLNCWDWGEEDSEEERKWMNEAYQKELTILKIHPIDIAFVPVDARLKKNFYKGIDAFLHQINVKMIFPMHFGDELQIVEQLYKHYINSEYLEKIQTIQQENQSFIV